MGSGILSFLIDFLGSSVVMYGIYVLLFRYKSGYNQSRLYLIAIPLLALLFSATTLRVLPPPVVASVETGDMPSNLRIVPDSEPLATPSMTPAIVEKAVENHSFNLAMILLAIYGIVVVARLGLLFYNVYLISSTKRWSTPEKIGSELVYRSGYVETPFSFLKYIFVSRRISVDRLSIIIQHEKAHIAHRHYIDKIAIELCTTFMWFNPIVWMIRKELGAVHEFQSDATVINSGVNLRDYQQLLFDEIEKNVPIVANGFNNSLIKKRFIMMRNGIENRYPVLRAALIVPLLATIFAFTSLGYEERQEAATDEVIRQIDSPATTDNNNIVTVASQEERNTHTDSPISETANNATPAAIETMDANTPVDKNKLADTPSLKTEEAEMKEVVISAIGIKRSDPELKDEIIELINTKRSAAEATLSNPAQAETAPVATTEKEHPVPTQVTIDSENQTVTISAKEENTIRQSTPAAEESTSTFVPVPLKKTSAGEYVLNSENTLRYYGSEQGLVNIVRTEKETRVLLTVNVVYDNTWVYFSKNTFLRDCETGDMYKVRRLERGMPLDEVLYFNGVSGLVQFTMVFPPLGKETKRIDYIQYNSDRDNRPTKFGNWKFSDIDLSEYPKKEPQVIF